MSGAPRLELDVRLPLDGFDLAVAGATSAGCLGIFGPSGAGKSSLLEVLAGLRPAVRGRLRFDGGAWLVPGGRPLPPEARRVGYVPQDDLLFPHLDVAGNLRASRFPSGPAPERVARVLELDGLLRRRVGTLSGGERRRVALGRALCAGPRLLLADEPLTGLDAGLRRRVLAYLLRVREEFAIPTVHVAHDATELKLLCDEVWRLERGRRVAEGPPETVLADAPDADNVWGGRVRDVARGLAHVEIATGCVLLAPAEGHVAGAYARGTLAPDDVLVATVPPDGLSARNALPARIVAVDPAPAAPAEADRDGASGGLRVRMVLGAGEAGGAGDDAGPRWTSAVTEDARRALELRPGRRVWAVFKTHACRTLPAVGDAALLDRTGSSAPSR